MEASESRTVSVVTDVETLAVWGGSVFVETMVMRLAMEAVDACSHLSCLEHGISGL